MLPEMRKKEKRKEGGGHGRSCLLVLSSLLRGKEEKVSCTNMPTSIESAGGGTGERD